MFPLLFALVSCGVPDAAPASSALAPTVATPSLADAQALIGLDRSAALNRLAAVPADLHRGDYGPSKGMEAIRPRPPIGGTVFLENGRVVLVSLYRGLKPPPEPTVFSSLNADELAATYPSAKALTSRSGNHFNHFVDPEAGVAWSAGEGSVTFMEVFAPTDLETYRRRFYQDPSAPPTLEDARALIGLDRAALLARVNASAADILIGNYGPSEGMETLHTRPPVNGSVFLQEGRVVLVLLNPGDPTPEPTVLGTTRPDALAAKHPTAIALRSRSGKHFNHWVDAAAGIAWSEGDGHVTYVELFEPTDLDSYKGRFYKEPMVYSK
ncbi:MAG: hypothetical protein V4850_25130 [Myxococcota bacterium]